MVHTMIYKPWEVPNFEKCKSVLGLVGGGEGDEDVALAQALAEEAILSAAEMAAAKAEGMLK